MGAVGSLDKAHEESAEFAQHEEHGNGGEHLHVSPARSSWFDPIIIGSSSMMPTVVAPSHACLISESPDPYVHDSFERTTLDDVFDMVCEPDTVIMQQAVSYRTTRDHRVDPSSSAYVAPPPPPHRRHRHKCSTTHGIRGLGGAGSQYGTPPTYYDFMSGPLPTTTQTETAPTDPSPPPVH
ncbi:hypothetical protein PIB30_029035 [Stylosanthes scabra]|uniref:Uncharacterized protein n=1 Tax=Stylosanthes scabra TaxID=79078 RepID=A0ABU6Z7Z0_9FABA|nr:hypothetical protein [Stylosanthes scabra]